jgi:hypothetical protein
VLAVVDDCALVLSGSRFHELVRDDYGWHHVPMMDG